MTNYMVTGIWSDTIVPVANDFMNWSKKVVRESGIPEFLASSAGDVALTALGLF